MSRKARDMGHPRRSFAYGNVKIENHSIPWEMIHRAAEVLCVRNEGYPAGLELRKVYRVLADEQASKRHQVRVIDESGEDYLYPEEFFVLYVFPCGGLNLFLALPRTYVLGYCLSPLRG